MNYSRQSPELKQKVDEVYELIFAIVPSNLSGPDFDFLIRARQAALELRSLASK